ncbi:MAG: TlpA disulfide reductase family protein [Bacteroidales bacterium]|nr:TlpA disulfide reductase family protein [Bacteroidales bacterium]HNW72738.1 TlpA disulfide reductase family protein [Bacteroidales bacterium]
MKKISVLLLLLVVSSAIHAQNVFTYKKLPSVNIKDMKGQPFSTDSITNNGKPIIVSFWATWCKPCVRELTTISDVYDDWVKETGVKLVAVSIDDSRSVPLVAPMINGKGWEYQVLLDPNSDFKRAMNVVTVPQTFLLNGKGEVVWQHTTFAEGDELELINLVRKLNRGEEIK